MTGFTAAGSPDRAASAAPVYRDRHETSLPLLILGLVVTVSPAAQLAWPSEAGFPGVLDWATGSMLAIALAGLWLTFRRRAASSGLRHPPGFGLAAIIGLLLIVPPFFVLVVVAGPFLVFGLGLTAAGIRLHNRVLTCWAVGIGGMGVFEGFFGITNRLPLSVWASWEHTAIYLLLGVAAVIAGVAVRIREGSARCSARSG